MLFKHLEVKLLEILKLLDLVYDRPQVILLLLLLNLLWGFIKMVLYNKIKIQDSWIAFVPVASYKPLFDLTGVNSYLLLTIFIPYIGSFIYNFCIVYVVYKFLKLIGHSRFIQVVGMFLIHFIIFYDAFFNDDLLRKYRRSLIKSRHT